MARLFGQIERQGPFADVTAMASPQRVAALKAMGKPFPSPRTIRALIDTGASGSALDDSVICMLGLSPSGQVPVHTPTTAPSGELRSQYDVSITIGKEPEDVRQYTVGIIAANLASEGFLVLIGWDILSRCVLRCDGPNRTFTLDY